MTQWLPESPRFDVLTGKRAKALETLARIAKENGKAMPRGKMIAYEQVRRCVSELKKEDTRVQRGPYQCLLL